MESREPGKRAMLRTGAVLGAAVYLLGVIVLATVERLGTHPGGIFEREVTGAELLLVYIGAHLPMVGTSVRWELLVFTAALAGGLLLAGFLLTRRYGGLGGEPFRTGSSVTAGYFPVAILASSYVVRSHDAVTTLQMVAPAVLVGFFYPFFLGGLGGVLAARYNGRSRDSSR